MGSGLIKPNPDAPRPFVIVFIIHPVLAVALVDVFPMCSTTYLCCLWCFRIFVVFLVAVSILWVPVIQRTQGGQLYMYIQGVAACLAPPIAAVYLIAILWRRCTEPVSDKAPSG